MSMACSIAHTKGTFVFNVTHAICKGKRFARSLLLLLRPLLLLLLSRTAATKARSLVHRAMDICVQSDSCVLYVNRATAAIN